ncbi:hypothetical protein CEXT_395621 [Caerostris extrusa]|uniref:Uncharacterized protein n=1 Tax=Caerostris extrusa TaxID=172846 RepID=A0AAV4Y8H9_CAEEX|nr:hypothetical protein CEXT_395621 [Caerostris extrusa]
MVDEVLFLVVLISHLCRTLVDHVLEIRLANDERITYFALHLHFRDVSIPQPYQQFCFPVLRSIILEKRPKLSDGMLFLSARHSSLATTAATSTRFSESSSDPQEGDLCSQDDAFDMG